MADKFEKRLEELKKAAHDVRLNKLLEEMVRLEMELDLLDNAEKLHYNPADKTQVKVRPAFYAYMKTLSAYKECVKLVCKQAEEVEADSPLREYLKKIKTSDTEYD